MPMLPWYETRSYAYATVVVKLKIDTAF